MREDLKHALRHVLCLANPSRMQGARWMRLDMKHVQLRIARSPLATLIYQTQVSTRLPAANWLKNRTDACV